MSQMLLCGILNLSLLSATTQESSVRPHFHAVGYRVRKKCDNGMVWPYGTLSVLHAHEHDQNTLHFSIVRPPTDEIRKVLARSVVTSPWTIWHSTPFFTFWFLCFAASNDKTPGTSLRAMPSSLQGGQCQAGKCWWWADNISIICTRGKAVRKRQEQFRPRRRRHVCDRTCTRSLLFRR